MDVGTQKCEINSFRFRPGRVFNTLIFLNIRKRAKINEDFLALNFHSFPLICPKISCSHRASQVSILNIILLHSSYVFCNTTRRSVVEFNLLTDLSGLLPQGFFFKFSCELSVYLIFAQSNSAWGQLFHP